VARALGVRGARYLHVLVPGQAAVARLAVGSGLFPVYEAEHGEVVSVSPIRRQVPVAEYARLVAPGSRAEIVDALQALADRTIAEYDLLPRAGTGPSPLERHGPAGQSR
jgi:pyruvate ferredoxin oxidoreductase beta subunit